MCACCPICIDDFLIAPYAGRESDEQDLRWVSKEVDATMMSLELDRHETKSVWAEGFTCVGHLGVAWD